MIFGNQAFSASFLTGILERGGFDKVGECSILVYKNGIPSDTAALNFDESLRSADLLTTFTGCDFITVANSLTLKTFPSSVITPSAGTASWAYLKGKNGVGVIVEAGVVGSNAALVLDKTACTANGTLSVVEFGVSLTFY